MKKFLSKFWILILIVIAVSSLLAFSYFMNTDKLSQITNLKAAYINEDKSIRLSWNSIDDVEGYLLYRSNLYDEKYILIDDISENIYTDMNVTESDIYKYKVLGYSKKGLFRKKGPYSVVVAGSDWVAPTGLKAKLESNGGTTLSWDPVEGAEGYKILRSDKYAKGYSSINAKIQNTTCIDTDSKGLIFFYKVMSYKTINGNKYFSPGSSPAYDIEFIEKNGVDLTAPKNVTAVKASEGIEISWESVEGADGYKVFRSEKAGKNYKGIINSTKDLSYKDSSAVEGKTYYYKVLPFVKYGDTRYFGEASKPVKVN